MVATSETIKEYGLVIDGQSVPALSGKTFDTVSPTTNLPIGRVPLAGIADAERAIAGRPQGIRRRTVAALDSAGAIPGTAPGRQHSARTARRDRDPGDA